MRSEEDKEDEEESEEKLGGVSVHSLSALLCRKGRKEGRKDKEY